MFMTLENTHFYLVLALWTWTISGILTVWLYRDEIDSPVSIGKVLWLVLAWPWWLAKRGCHPAADLKRIKIRVGQEPRRGSGRYSRR